MSDRFEVDGILDGSEPGAQADSPAAQTLDLFVDMATKAAKGFAQGPQAMVLFGASAEVLERVVNAAREGAAALRVLQQTGINN